MMKLSVPLMFAVLGLAACDTDDTSAPTVAAEFRAVKIGEAWGPCKGGPGGECASGQGALCLDDGMSSICSPACKAGGCPSVPVTVCGGPVLPGCRLDGACIVACVTDADCFNQTVCSADGICAHPE